MMALLRSTQFPLIQGSNPMLQSFYQGSASQEGFIGERTQMRGS